MARTGLILCALLLAGCADSSAPTAPSDPTGDEARALADAEAMLDQRSPPPAPAPQQAQAAP